MWKKRFNHLHLFFLKLSKIKFDKFLKTGYEILNKTKRKYETVMGSQTCFSTTYYIISFVATHNTSLTKKKKNKS